MNFSELCRGNSQTLRVHNDALTCCEKEVELHVGLEANVSWFPLIFINLSGFSISLVTTCILRGLFTEDIYHGTIMIYETKTISCTIRATCYVLENKTQLSWQLWNKARHQVTALPHVRSAYLFFFLSFSLVSSANRFGKHDRCVRGAHLWDSDCVLDTVYWKILAQKGNQEVEFEQDGHKVCNNVGMMT